MTPRQLWWRVGTSLVAAVPVGGFCLGLLHAGDPDPNPIGRIAHAFLMAVMTPLCGGFPPHHAAGEGRTLNAWPSITAAFLLIMAWRMDRGRTTRSDSPMHSTPPASPSKDDILALLARLREDGLGFWRRVEPDRFWSRPDEGWSPAENVRHLTKCTTPVARALRLPRWILRALFGVAEAPSRDVDALRSTYLAGLKRGAAAGRYAPAPAPPPPEPVAGQQRIIEACREAIAGLERALRPWPDADLDRQRLPHPVLGPLSLREMLLFTVLHFDHHRDIVARRLADRPPLVPDSRASATSDQD